MATRIVVEQLVRQRDAGGDRGADSKRSGVMERARVRRNVHLVVAKQAVLLRCVGEADRAFVCGQNTATQSTDQT